MSLKSTKARVALLGVVLFGALGCSGLKDRGDRAGNKDAGDQDGGIGGNAANAGVGGNGSTAGNGAAGDQGVGGMSGAGAEHAGSGGEPTAGSGQEAGTGGDGPPDSDPPEVVIDFPPAGLTDRATIHVRGHVSDPDGTDIREVRVHDALAQLQDDGSFAVDAPLPIGTHPLAVHVVDDDGVESDLDATVIERSGYLFVGAGDMLLDRDHDRVLAVDSATDAIVAIDLDDGTRNVIAAESESPVGRSSLWLDPSGERVLVTEPAAGALAWIDLATGERSVISDSTHGSGPAIEPLAAAIDPSQPTLAFVVVQQHDQSPNTGLFTIDLGNGNRSEAAGAGPALGYSNDIVYDADRAQFLVASSQGLVGIDPISHERRRISTRSDTIPSVGHGPDWLAIHHIELDGDRALLSAPENQVGRPCVFEVDLASGDRKNLAELALGSDPPLHNLLDGGAAVAFDAVSGEMLALDNAGRLVSASLIAGHREPFSQALYGSGPQLERPEPIIDFGQRWLVMDNASATLFAIDPDSGDRSVFSDAGDSGQMFGQVHELVADASNNRVLALDETALYAIDPATGDRSVLANDAAMASFAGASGFAINGEGTHAYLVGCYGPPYPCTSRVFDIDLSNGNATELTLTGLASVPALSAIAQYGDVFVLAAEGSLLRLDEQTGAVSVIADGSTGSGYTLHDPRALSVDFQQRRALVVDVYSSPETVLEVNLDNGDRTVLASGSFGSGPTSDVISDAIWDLQNDRVLVTQRSNANGTGVLAIALAGQARTLLADQGFGDSLPLAPLFDAQSDQLYFAARDPRATAAEGTRLISLGLESGLRTELSDDQSPGQPAAVMPWAHVIDSAHEHLFSCGVTLSQSYAIVETDLADGAKRLVSDGAVDNGAAFGAAFDLAWDDAHSRLLVPDFSNGALLAIDPATGARTLLSGGPEGSGDALVDPTAIALDPANDRVLLLATNQIIEVELDSGDRAVLSGASAGSGAPFVQLTSMRLDETQGRLLVIDRGDDTHEPQLIAVSLDDGARTPVLPLQGSVESNPSNLFERIVGPPFSYDGPHQVAYIGALFMKLSAFDMESGQHVLMAGIGK